MALKVVGTKSGAPSALRSTICMAYLSKGGNTAYRSYFHQRLADGESFEMRSPCVDSRLLSGHQGIGLGIIGDGFSRISSLIPEFFAVATIAGMVAAEYEDCTC